MNSKELARSTAPTVGIIAAGEAARDAFGHRSGSQVLKVTPELLSALENGKQLAIEIKEGEYVLFVEKESDVKENREQALWRTVKYWEGRTPPPEYFLHPALDQGDYKRLGIDHQKLSAYIKQTKKTPVELTYEEVQQFVVEPADGW